MIKATKPKQDEPFRYEPGENLTLVLSLIFVGNIAGEKSWARIGSSFNRLDVLGVSSTRRYNSKQVGRGFKPGDGFVHYSTGERLVIARGRNGHGELVYRLREMHPTEQALVARGIRTAERELRWRRDSYCEDARRAATRR